MKAELPWVEWAYWKKVMRHHLISDHVALFAPPHP